jgi:hypothetical protein
VSTMTAALLGLVLAQPTALPPQQSKETADLLIEASISTAGPYGELWVLRLTLPCTRQVS